MSATKVIAVFDIGKTNKKILLFDKKMKVVYNSEQKFATTVDEDGFECDDIQLIQDWIIATLDSIVSEGKFDIQGINFSTYGASLAYINKDGKLLTPIYNYLKEVNPDIQNELFRANGGIHEFCRRTASPALGSLLNSGIQALWLKTEKKELWSQVNHILHFPQYLSNILTGKVTSEPTSVGCHTFVWDFDNMKYHPWVKDEEVNLPDPVNNNTVYPAMIKGKEIKTGVGIHDSSASLVPYLENSKEKFILVSTGTWCISMNPYNDEPLTSDQLYSDCLCFLTPGKQQVKSSRLFMGYFHEKLIERLNGYFCTDISYFKTVPYQKELILSLKEGFGDSQVFFPLGIRDFDKGIEKIDFSVFKTFEDAYTCLVMELTELCIKSINLIIPADDQTEVLYVSGGFARNQIYLNLLTDHFSEKKVYTSEIDNASALGAALVIADNLEGFDKSQVELIQDSKI